MDDHTLAPPIPAPGGFAAYPAYAQAQAAPGTGTGYGLVPAYGTPDAFAPGGFPPGTFPPGGFPPGYNPYLGTYAGPRYASVWLRIAAYVLDGAIMGAVNYAVSLVFFIAVAVLMGIDEEAIALTTYLAVIILNIVLTVVYTVSQEAKWGQTLGKRAVGIQVVKADGGEMDVDAALIRYAFLFFAFLGLGGLVTILMVALSDTKQRIGDRVAGTIVVKTR